jgi:hypothetical protein
MKNEATLYLTTDTGIALLNSSVLGSVTHDPRPGSISPQLGENSNSFPGEDGSTIRALATIQPGQYDT